MNARRAVIFIARREIRERLRGRSVRRSRPATPRRRRSLDLVPLPDRGYTVIELSVAVDFDVDHTLAREDAYTAAATALRLLPDARARDRRTVAVP